MKRRSIRFISILSVSLLTLVVSLYLDANPKWWWWLITYLIGEFIARSVWAGTYGVNITGVEILEDRWDKKKHFRFTFTTIRNQKGIVWGSFDENVDLDENNLRRLLYQTLLLTQANRVWLDGEEVRHTIRNKSESVELILRPDQ